MKYNSDYLPSPLAQDIASKHVSPWLLPQPMSISNHKVLHTCWPSLCPQPAQTLPWHKAFRDVILSSSKLLEISFYEMSSGKKAFLIPCSYQTGVNLHMEHFASRVRQMPVILLGQYRSQKLWSGQPSPGTHPLKIFSSCPLPTRLGVCSGRGWQELKFILLVAQDSKWHPQVVVE